jgi:hypothetical protein
VGQVSTLQFYLKRASLLGIILALPLAAQFSSGIEGTVTDPSGSAVGGADITVTDQSTGVPQKPNHPKAAPFVFCASVLAHIELMSFPLASEPGPQIRSF